MELKKAHFITKNNRKQNSFLEHLPLFPMKPFLLRGFINYYLAYS